MSQLISPVTAGAGWDTLRLRFPATGLGRGFLSCKTTGRCSAEALVVQTAPNQGVQRTVDGWVGRCQETSEPQDATTSHMLSGPLRKAAPVGEAPSALPGFLPRGAFFTDTSESESELESDLVMSTVAFPISESESTLESESEPDSTFCGHRAQLNQESGSSSAARPKPQQLGAQPGH